MRGHTCGNLVTRVEIGWCMWNSFQMIIVVMTTNDQTGPTWEQFGLQHNWGRQGTKPRQESKKAKKKRMKGMTNNAKKKKNREKTYQEFHQTSIEGTNITMTDAEVFGDSMKKKAPTRSTLDFTTSNCCLRIHDTTKADN